MRAAPKTPDPKYFQPRPSVTTGPEWLGLVLGGLLIGAFWGALFGSSPTG